MESVYCERGAHEVHPDDVAHICDETNEAICWACKDRVEAEILDDIYADLEQRNAYEAAQLAYHPETTDWIGEEVPF